MSLVYLAFAFKVLGGKTAKLDQAGLALIQLQVELAKTLFERLQKSGVSVVYEYVSSIAATGFLPMINAAEPAAAVYSNASPGLAWAVSEPTARP